jgi:raffinose/stachyose/melibiose transport system permease protein
MFRYTGKSLTREIVMLIVALAMISPFYLLFNIAFKTEGDALATSPVALPTNPTFVGFETAVSGEGSRSILLGMLNSFIITGGSVLLLIAIGSIGAYTLARRVGRVSKLMMTLVVIAIALPVQLGIIPIYAGMRTFGLVGNHVGMIILYTGLLMPLALLLYSGFARTLPRDYEESAQVAGASPFTTFRLIVFPLLAPATGTVAILAGLIIWNDFFTSLVFLNGTEASTLPVVVYSFVGELVSSWNVIFAAVIISMIPILAFYLFAQKRFIQGFAGGIK